MIWFTELSGQLDFEAMNEACKVLFDYIDFTMFQQIAYGCKDE